MSGIVENHCGEPVQLTNGGWSMKKSPMTVYYSCNSGYKLNGPLKQLCLNNGTWDPPESPVCVGKSLIRSLLVHDTLYMSWNLDNWHSNITLSLEYQFSAVR